MPLSFVRKGNPRVYIPGYKSSVSQSGFNAAVNGAYQGLSNAPKFGEFDADEFYKIENGRADLNANQLINLAIKAPTYALEAPLRPADALLGGVPGAIAGGIQGVISQIPVLNTIIGGAGEALKQADYAGAGFINYLGADALRQSIGKPDNYRLGLFGGGQTAGEARRNAIMRWSTDMEGNQYTLEELEARAQENPWNFGQFATSEDGLTDFLIRSVVNPTNLLLTPAGGAALRGIKTGANLARESELAIQAGARYLEGTRRAAVWARPIIKATTPIATPFRYGYGYAESMGRGIAKATQFAGKAYDEAHTPIPREFFDVGNAARDVLNGGLARSGYNGSLLQAMAWLGRGTLSTARKVYFPGVNTELKGARLVGSAARAWMRGGLQQELVGIGGEYLFGGIDAYLDENNMQNSFIGGTVNTIHDILSKINNQHPLSDHDGFVLASMFLPFSRAAREIPGEAVGRFRKARLPMYADNVAAQVVDRANKLGFKGKADDMFEYLGDGDIQRGRTIFEWGAEVAEVRKVENQLSHLTHRVLDAELDGFAERMQYTGQLIRENIMRRRESGALRPGSTADYMYELHREAGLEPGRIKAGEAGKERGLSSEFTPTATSLFDEMKNMYRAHEVLGPQLSELGLHIVKGGVLTKETLDSMIAHLDTVDTFDQNLARQILDMGPSLVYDNDFWREFSVTLGRKDRSGIRGRKVTEAESVTKDDLRAALNDVRDRIPSQQELFHQTIRMAKSTGKVQKGVFQIKEPPYPMGAKVKANRTKAAGKTSTYAVNDRQITKMRNNEYYKNGQAKFGTADEVKSSRGGVYRRQANGSYARDDGVAVNISEGAIQLDIPASREANLMAELRRTVYQSGPRKGQIKPGMEELSQRINLDIEAARMGIDLDALLLATENGGRVIVADPIAGPWLARRGYVESARIEHRYPDWVDPGEKPIPPNTAPVNDAELPKPGDTIHFIDIYGRPDHAEVVNQMDDGVYIAEKEGQVVTVDPSEIIDSTSGWKGIPFAGEEEAVKAWGEYDKAYGRWVEEMQNGVQRGSITKQQAAERGLRSEYLGTYEPLPPVLYHATTNVKGIKQRGVLTGMELRDIFGTRKEGLGGAPGTTVSFTDDPEVAARIAEVLVETGEVLRGDIKISDLVARAKKGGFDEAWLGGKGTRTRELYDRYLKMERTGKWEYEDKLDSFVNGVYTVKTRKLSMDADQIIEERYGAYKEFLRAQNDAGGPMNPLLVSRDPVSLSKIRREDVGVVRARPKGGAQGFNDQSEKYLKEWKVVPDAVELEGISNRAAYSFRGGDPTAIEKNSAAGAFAPYRPTRRIERTERAAIGVARGDARKAGLLLPTDWSVGPAVTEQTSMFPEERLRNLQEHTRATRNAYKLELEKVSKMDELAFSLLPFDKKITDMNLSDWVSQASGVEMAKFKDFMQAMEEFPALSAQTGPRFIVDPAADRFTMLQTSLNRRRQILMDYGALSPIQRFYDAVLAPKHARWLGKQAQNEVHNLLTTVGWSPGATRQFMAKVKKEILDSKSVVGFGKLTGAHRFPSVQALPEEKLRAIAREIAPAEAQAVIDRFGTFQHMITQASNRLLRTTEKAARSGAPVNPITRAADAAFRTWQYEKGFRSVSGATQRFTKYTYPYLRFFADPLFAMMNWIEPYAYNIFNNGWRGVRPAGPGARRRSELASAGIIPPGGLYSKETASELLLADPGFTTLPKNIRPNLEREFEIRTDKVAEQMFEALGRDHPIATMMRERFGDNVKDWAGEFNRLMESLAEKGPEQTVRIAAQKTLEKELGFSHAELKQMLPVVERLTEKYRGIYADMADLYVGRMSRSNLERLSNSFFLFWPISYMLKVVPWAYRVMMEQIGPVKGSAGAYLWDQYRQQYESLLQNNEDFADWVEDNPDFMFAAEMILPITPASIGTSLNKTTRYAGNWFMEATELGKGDEFGDYQPKTIPEALESSTRFGPFRTLSLASNVLEDWGVPGFYAEPSGNTGPTFVP